eukprot:1148596-Pelagomonas_calceolata.AAC.4
MDCAELMGASGDSLQSSCMHRCVNDGMDDNGMDDDSPMPMGERQTAAPLRKPGMRLLSVQCRCGHATWCA